MNVDFDHFCFVLEICGYIFDKMIGRAVISQDQMKTKIEFACRAGRT